MTSPAEGAEVLDITAEDRFVVRDEGGEAELDYRVEGGRMFLVHTEVPDVLGGRGVGGLLVSAAIRRAAAEGLVVVPWCPFARRYLRHHPDEAAPVTVEWTQPPHGGTGHGRDGRRIHPDDEDRYLDEQEEESFPASDPHSDWAGPRSE